MNSPVALPLARLFFEPMVCQGSTPMDPSAQAFRHQSAGWTFAAAGSFAEPYSVKYDPPKSVCSSCFMRTF